eukprot:TRINITY_DN2077_c0_g1_i1.p1 TRINITY_DN2077_c0_g1~~TRINITY_DN2077_c0_g1_i1.p1  ORF type:complete len:1051 (-),score=230.23 TRINITY_DN2077_c0_g1_i1:158-3310(-)
MGGGGAADAPLGASTEADITDDVPTGSRHLSSFLRRTRQNKIRKVVREVYLRDDINPEHFEGADQILVLDTNIVLHQMDLIAEEECINHVVVPYTVLQEVRHRNMGTYARLRALCRLEPENGEEGGERKIDDAHAELMDDGLKVTKAQTKLKSSVRETVKDMAKARNARRFYVFPNEFFRETYVERLSDESQNDRNDRAIRRVAHWYRRHVIGPEVLLLTDDRACKAKAVADGLAAFTAKDFIERMKPKFPEAGEKLAFREEAEGEEAGGVDSSKSLPATPRGVKRKDTSQTSGDRSVYPAHLKASEVERGLKSKRLFQGVLRMHMNSCMHGTVSCGVEEIEVNGRLALNRAIDGDVVVVEKLDGQGRVQVLERADKKLRTEVADAEFGDSGVAPSVTDELIESSVEKTQSTAASDRPKGQIVGIIKRNWREYAGTLKPLHVERQEETGPSSYNKADRIFVSADARLPNIMIQTRHSANLENKRIVVIIDGWDRFSHYPRGHWTKILGDVGDRDTESAVILHEHGVITREFGEAVYRCLPPSDWQPTEEDIVGRTDFRNVIVCSVDPPGCKDIDDALSCEELPNGNFKVGVHIADVTHFVHADTAIDREAAERCTTVYLVERRTDMLPGLLTTDICSLRGGVERLTFSCVWEMTPDAEIVNTTYCKAIIKSAAALSYAEAQTRIDDPSDSSPITKSLRNLLNLTKKIRAARVAAGALELASQEVRFELDSETQDPTDVKNYQLRETNKLVEELMLLANCSVATKILQTFPMFGVLRRHPPPKDEQLKTLKKLLANNGISDFEFGSNKELSTSLEKAVKPEDPFFNTLVRIMATRCMNQAVYFCTGEVQPALYPHYGLAMERYTHFTSPIRRYADVLVHRLLAASLGITPLAEQLQSKSAISDQCDKINLKHRNAQWASRASADLHTFMFFNKKGAQSVESVVTRIRRTGMQVNVPRYGIEGVVPMAEEDWLVKEEEQLVISKKDPSVVIGIFSYVMVHIEADNSEFRNRTKLQFERAVKESERDSYKAIEESRKQVQQEMFPDMLEREAN